MFVNASIDLSTFSFFFCSPVFGALVVVVGVVFSFPSDDVRSSCAASKGTLLSIQRAAEKGAAREDIHDDTHDRGVR